MIQDRAIIIMEGEHETAPKLSNGTSSNDLEWVWFIIIDKSNASMRFVCVRWLYHLNYLSGYRYLGDSDTDQRESLHGSQKSQILTANTWKR